MSGRIFLGEAQRRFMSHLRGVTVHAVYVGDPHPTCAVCSKHVDEFRRERSELRGVEIFVATCHGEEERVELTDRDLAFAAEISVGEAFTTKRLKNE